MNNWKEQLYLLCDQVATENLIKECEFIDVARRYFRRQQMFRGIGDPVDKFFALCDFVFEYPEAINTNITMKYEEFLQTPYWVVIREYVLFKWNNKCALCGSSENLNVHHRTYEHRGREHTHISDLVVLCNSCHAKFHDKLAE